MAKKYLILIVYSILQKTDTSGSLNVCTPLSGKDFTREFTSRIHERCQLPVHAQQTKTILDPNSGKISTIISAPVPIDDATSPQTTPPAKKPSYLNLACCVNGYSNLTTYDSKFRQSINKSREVSPIRPITHTVQYNRGGSNYLVVPVSIPINAHNKTTSMMDAHTILSPEKRFFSQQKTTLEMGSTGGRDITDNINSNGCTSYFKKTILTSSATTTMTTTSGGGAGGVSGKDSGNDVTKSFIQQRVERLYGPGALAQGLYSPKKPKQTDENGGSVSLSSILVEKSQNSSKFNGWSTNVFPTNCSSGTRTSDVENVNVDASGEAPLPVLRHLRPEFRAQLPMLSPKRTTPIKASNGDILSSSNGKIECQNGIDVSPSNGIGSSTYCSGSSSSSSIAKPITNGCLNTNTRASNAADENSLTSTKCDTEHKGEFCQTVKNGSSNNSSSSTSSHNTSVTELLNAMNSICISDTDHSELSNGQSSMAAASQSFATPIKRKSIDEASSTSAAIKIIESDANGNLKTETQSKDALYFLATVHSERDRLIGMAVEIEKELDTLLQVRWETLICATFDADYYFVFRFVRRQRDDIDEDMFGHLRSAGGKARLLATQKFKQFEGNKIDSLASVFHFQL